jgi:hypothetical protein
LILNIVLRLFIDDKCSSHDWAFDILKVVAAEVAESPAPFNARVLEKSLRFTGDALGGKFPSISITKHFIDNHDVQNIHGKATWTYLLSGRYNLEITLHHKWKQNTSVPPITTATVALYSTDWDDDMRPGVAPPRPWNDGFSSQFLKPYPGDAAPGVPSNANDRLSHFLAWVQWIQKALDGDSK